MSYSINAGDGDGQQYVYEFEDALSLEELEGKTRERIARGWRTTGKKHSVVVALPGQPRRWRYFQAFYRQRDLPPGNVKPAP